MIRQLKQLWARQRSVDHVWGKELPENCIKEFDLFYIKTCFDISISLPSLTLWQNNVYHFSIEFICNVYLLAHIDKKAWMM
jgi:hypothetical protein